jgi:hypothetical protein
MFCKIVSTSTFDLTSSVFFPLVIIIVVF